MKGLFKHIPVKLKTEVKKEKYYIRKTVTSAKFPRKHRESQKINEEIINVDIWEILLFFFCLFAFSGAAPVAYRDS